MINDVQNWLITKGFRPKVEHFLLFSSFDGHYVGCSRSFTLQQVEGNTISHPDIFIENLKLVIEIDGNEKNNIHEIKKKKTDERNEIYKRGGMNLIIINPQELRIRNQTWQEYVKFKLYEMYGMF